VTHGEPSEVTGDEKGDRPEETHNPPYLLQREGRRLESDTRPSSNELFLVAYGDGFFPFERFARNAQAPLNVC
jgi:hypothetical protein